MHRNGHISLKDHHTQANHINPTLARTTALSVLSPSENAGDLVDGLYWRLPIEQNYPLDWMLEKASLVLPARIAYQLCFTTLSDGLSACIAGRNGENVGRGTIIFSVARRSWDTFITSARQREPLGTDSLKSQNGKDTV
jgi:hypothetical protein